MQFLCTICARGGSKGVPNKNIRILNGKPLIVYSIEQALSIQTIDCVIVSTDSDEIARIAAVTGAEVPFRRPYHLASDTAPKIPVVQHAVQYVMDNVNARPEYVIDLDPTSPLRNTEDIERCIELLRSDPDCDSVITGYRSNKNPYFNMVEVRKDGFARVSKTPSRHISRRQDAPLVYTMNASIYGWKRGALFNQKNIFDGRVKLVEMTKERSIDIDSEIDFKLVGLLLKERFRDDFSR